MSRIFLSHSSENNAEAMALRLWLEAGGWDDVFLDVDAERGIRAGEHWEQALREAAFRCEAVLFLVSRAWLGSEWCRDEFKLARHLGKRLFGILIEDTVAKDLPPLMTREWQLVNIAAAGPKTTFSVVPPQTADAVEVGFSTEGLRRLKFGLVAAGLDVRFFAWPPEHDPDRPPYRGLLPLEAEDAGIFFGRDAQIIEALDDLRGMRNSGPPRVLVVLGASGAGKSSFMRAGLLPRLVRDDRNFLALPIVRPARAAINGETGLVRSIETALQACGLASARADIRSAVAAGAGAVRLLLTKLVECAQRSALYDTATVKAPLIVLPIDQGEELFLVEGGEETEQLLTLLRDLTAYDAPGLLVLFTIRSDSYERLQTVKTLEGIRQQTLSLPPMQRGAYHSVIEGPAQRLRDGPRALTIDAALTRALLADIESGGGRDALALLAFTLERLYLEFKGRGRLLLADYISLGRIKGSIEAAVESALAAADADLRIPRDHAARLLLLRRGLIPWLAGIDPETNNPRRRVARRSEIPEEARPLIERFIDQRLLSSDVDPESHEVTIEPTHETLLRQWGLLQGWLLEDAGLLGVLEGVKRASRDWAANGKDTAWLTHATGRLKATERLRERPDLAALLEATDRDYLAACRKREQSEAGQQRRNRSIAAVLCVIAVAGLGYAGWANWSYLKARMEILTEIVRPKVLTTEQEHILVSKAIFQECAHCPEMIVIPAGTFMMGAPDGEVGSRELERPQHQVTIAHPFAASRLEVTFDEWEACYQLGGCTKWPTDHGWGRGSRPVINVSWEDAQEYVTWLRKRTGKPYRLLTEAEWEYAARAGSRTAYSWGDKIDKEENGRPRANCDSCGSQWDNQKTAPAGSFAPNVFGLHDMHGNLWEWVEDCYQDGYEGAPTDGSAIVSATCPHHVLRGGSWFNGKLNIRSATRFWPRPRIAGEPDELPSTNEENIGFRMGRSLAIRKR